MDAPLTHLAAFIRIESPDDMLRRFAGIADLAAEWILGVHEVAVRRAERRVRRSGVGASDTRDAPFAAGTFPESNLPGPTLAAVMLDKLVSYVEGRSQLTAYAVRVAPSDLYRGPVRNPPDLSAIHHRIPQEYICRICLSAKSHPVIFSCCEHSFCYVCARLAFNESFACPVCQATQYEAPLPADHEWNHIEYEILPEIDWTIIDEEGWEGIRFPRRVVA
ncbi:hypothetical protein C8F01DRAFT_1255027 [Mycena amicta]|nr:hypothetical protein C8F01DRAFT_1255027 [Mycena amicta]